MGDRRSSPGPPRCASDSIRPTPTQAIPLRHTTLCHQTPRLACSGVAPHGAPVPGVVRRVHDRHPSVFAPHGRPSAPIVSRSWGLLEGRDVEDSPLIKQTGTDVVGLTMSRTMKSSASQFLTSRRHLPEAITSLANTLEPHGSTTSCTERQRRLREYRLEHIGRSRNPTLSCAPVPSLFFDPWTGATNIVTHLHSRPIAPMLLTNFLTAGELVAPTEVAEVSHILDILQTHQPPVSAPNCPSAPWAITIARRLVTDGIARETRESPAPGFLSLTAEKLESAPPGRIRILLDTLYANVLFDRLPQRRSLRDFIRPLRPLLQQAAYMGILYCVTWDLEKSFFQVPVTSSLFGFSAYDIDNGSFWTSCFATAKLYHDTLLQVAASFHITIGAISISSNPTHRGIEVDLINKRAKLIPSKLTILQARIQRCLRQPPITLDMLETITGQLVYVDQFVNAFGVKGIHSLISDLISHRSLGVNPSSISVVLSPASRVELLSALSWSAQIIDLIPKSISRSPSIFISDASDYGAALGYWSLEGKRFDLIRWQWPSGFSSTVPIWARELLPVIVAKFIGDKDAPHFYILDNTTDVGAINRRYSSSPMLFTMLWYLLRFHAPSTAFWIPSALNIMDGPSRGFPLDPAQLLSSSDLVDGISTSWICDGSWRLGILPTRYVFDYSHQTKSGCDGGVTCLVSSFHFSADQSCPAPSQRDIETRKWRSQPYS